MKKFGEVTFLYDADDVAGTATVEGGGVTAVTPAKELSDATTTTPDPAALQAQLAKLESDRRAQQSISDRKIAEAERKATELAHKLEQFTLQGLDEPAKVAYERDQLKTRLEELEAKERIRDYATAFAKELHISEEELDTTNEETIAQSGWAAAIKRMHELEEQISKPASSVKTEPAKATPTNTTKIITGSGAVPKVAKTQIEFMGDIAKSLGKTTISQEDFYRWAERHPDAMNQWLQDQHKES